MNRQQKQYAITFLLIAGILLLAVVTGLYFFGNYRKTYKSPVYHFSIKYPVKWEVTDDFAGAAVVLASPLSSKLDYFRESVNVVVQDLSAQPMSLLEYTKIAVNQMRVVFKSGIEILDSGPTTVSNLPAHKFVFIGKGPDGDVRYDIIWTIKGYTAYQITATSLASQYASNAEDLTKILNSFRVR